MLFESLLSKVAAAGLASKAAAGGAAVVVAASAAGTAGALPEPAQNAFDEITVEETVEVDDIEVLDDEGDAEDSTFGQETAADARGDATDDDPGVDGCEIAREASGRDLEDCGTDTDDAEGADTDESDAMEGFGEDVSEDAQDGGVDGEDISQEARDRNPGDGDEGTDNAPEGVDTERADADADADADDDDDEEETDADGGPEGTPGADAAANRDRASDEG